MSHIYACLHMAVTSCGTFRHCGRRERCQEFALHDTSVCFVIVKEVNAIWGMCLIPSHVPREGNVSFRFPNSLLVYCSLPLYTTPLCPLPRSLVGEKCLFETYPYLPRTLITNSGETTKFSD